MKKLIVICLCLISVCCLFTSCSASMARPHFPTENNRPSNDTRANDNEGSAGDYQADGDGTVRSYQSDNDFSF